LRERSPSGGPFRTHEGEPEHRGYIKVAVARPLEGELTYSVPADLELQVGHVVLVPLGSQAETGYVVQRLDEPDLEPSKIKAVTRLVDPLPAFDARQLNFFRWIADYYLSPLGMVIATALPSGIRAKSVRVLVPTDPGLLALTQRAVEGTELQVLREVVSRPGLTRRGLRRRLGEELEGDEVDRKIDQLVRLGHIDWIDREVNEAKGRVKTVARANQHVDPGWAAGPRQAAILRWLPEDGSSRDLNDLLAEHGEAARASCNRLVELGYVVMGERELRDALTSAAPMGPKDPPPPNPDQLAALAALADPAAQGPYLLFGVTGSGKTEVFLGATRTVLDRGKQVLVLVPEIGLTPQLVGRFRARFGDNIAVLHSGLTGGERLAQWRRIRAGEAQVAVGARSALFAPFQQLGLVVVDEEHDDSYKQEEGVPYHARDLAVVLGRNHGCPVLLASATPSLETWHNALLGRYALLRLPNRATPRPVPTIELVDLTEIEGGRGGSPDDKPLLAPEVVFALEETFRKGGQAIVLYNRRGYATLVECTSCGSSYECPNCAISMTLHKMVGTVCCHYCGLKLPYSRQCPVCGSTALDEEGKGTERIEEKLAEMFPDVPIGRMDADTTAGRGAHERILAEFREGRTRLLVGTQIVAKGHDFPGVHCAVVISADRSFRMPDFRAAERTAALLVQLAGRAGRGAVAGRVFVQTYKPDHYVLQHLRDLERFYETELKLRATMRYPPFTRLVLIRMDGVDRKVVLHAAETLGRKLRTEAKPYKVSVLGPAPAALPRLVGRWRFQLIIRSESVRELRTFLDAVRGELVRTGKQGVRVHWDVDPRQLM
jgi:primosomal protein N' (replication factor Y)